MTSQASFDTPLPKLHKVLVYGTLMNGMMNHHLLKEAGFCGNAMTILPRWGMVKTREYPIAIHYGGKGRIAGELYEVDDELLKRIDHLEGCDMANLAASYYRRVETLVVDDDDSIHRAWVYYMLKVDVDPSYVNCKVKPVVEVESATSLDLFVWDPTEDFIATKQKVKTHG